MVFSAEKIQLGMCIVGISLWWWYLVMVEDNLVCGSSGVKFNDGGRQHGM